ncbi:MAG: hypothetical protein KKE24_02015 [Candidatus Thermoplasmatota archaeon]|nr:hypothetical protein [Candidatus Thermoplasmatota archaeon]
MTLKFMIVKLNQFETKIVKILQDWYPITVEEMRDELRMRPDTLDRNLKSLVLKGVISLDHLPDKTYIRLLMSDVHIAPKGKRPKTGDDPSDIHEDMMFL